MPEGKLTIWEDIAFSNELIDNENVYDFDMAKLSINTSEIGLAGIEVYDILRDDYGIQVEFGDLGNILAVVSAGDRAMEIERLISALYEIKDFMQRIRRICSVTIILSLILYAPHKKHSTAIRKQCP